MNLWRRFLHEPLVHFLLAGALLFLLFGTDQPEPSDHRVVIIGRDTVDRLATQYEATWRRPPSAEELDGLVESYVVEEILYREALALGLDRNDAVVRQRMAIKMMLLADGAGTPEPPDETALETFLRENAARYELPAQWTFEQVFFSRDRRGKAAATEAEAALDAMANGTPSPDVGDPGLLPYRLDAAEQPTIDAAFGEGFAEQIDPTLRNRWQGPIESAFGSHLVRVQHVTPVHLPALDDIRVQVEDDWLEMQRRDARQRFVDALREAYRVEMAESRTDGDAGP